MYGWAGTILRVDLTKGKIVKEPLSEKLRKNYIGGTGIASKILYDEVPPRTKPFDPKSIVILNTGPLTGTFAPSCGRYSVTMKSPVTGIYGDSNGGGFWAPELKWAGYDHIVIQGKSEKPVYLWIDDDEVELRDASHLWGKDTWETQRLIREELGDPEIKTLKIGPAGENMTAGGCLIGDLSRAAGRTGAGAVLGSKKLKAIAVRGSKGINIAKLDEFMRLCEKLFERIKEDPLYEPMRNLGTPSIVSDPFTLLVGDEAFENITAASFAEKCWTKNLGCFNCPLCCSHWCEVKEGPYAGTKGEGLEGNLVLDYGLDLRCRDPYFLVKINIECNKLGVGIDDPAATFAWIIQMMERGLITTKDTDGIELTWGNQEAILKMLYKYVYREGCGDIFADGSVKAAKKLKRGLEKYVDDIKGIQTVPCIPWFPGYPEKPASFTTISVGTALSHGVATRGADHLKGMPFPEERPWGLGYFVSDEFMEKYGEETYGTSDFYEPFTTEGKADLVFSKENAMYILDMGIICKYIGTFGMHISGLTTADIAMLISAATGADCCEKDLIDAAKRANAIQRAYNAREGVRREDDYSPEFVHPDTFGDPGITREDYDKLLDRYYNLRGCDLVTGIPTREILEELGLNDIADDLAKRGILPK